MPWSASSGATKKARTIESPTSAAASGREQPEREIFGAGYSETTYSKDAQHSIAKTASYSPRKAR